MHRRRFLATTGAAALTAIAGCTTGSGGGGDATTTQDGATTTTGSGGTRIEDHPAAAGLADQPVKGDLGGNVVLAFEDPSCPRCRAFETGTVPRIESELVETGQAAYVYRNYPVIYPWGKPATQALEATFDRSADAFWALVDHYYTNQSDFTTNNVLDRTATFLTENTGVDGDAVAADAEAKRFDAAVQADLTAGQNADVGRTTPTIFLFRDGEYVTRASGSISYEVIATALGVS